MKLEGQRNNVESLRLPGHCPLAASREIGIAYE